jgi:hypothetical protein
MVRLIISTALIVAGVMLANDIGHVAGSMTLLVARNPATIAVTGYLSENAPAPVFAFEQYVLVHFALAPYFIIAGGFAGFAMPFRYAKCGSLLPFAYSVCFSVLLIRMAAEVESLTWVSFLDEILSSFALIPIYMLGVNLGRTVNERRRPRWNVIDCFLATTICAILSFAVVYRPFMLIPTTILGAVSYVVWRMWPTVHGAAEQSIEPKPTAQSS